MKITEFINKNSQEIEKFNHAAALRPDNIQERDKISLIFEEIALACQGHKDQQIREQLLNYYQDLVDKCYDYVDIVCEFERLVQKGELGEEFNNVDQNRKIVHDATISSFNILSRLMAKNGLDNSWIKPLVEGGRVVYGHYAIRKSIGDVLIYNRENQK